MGNHPSIAAGAAAGVHPPALVWGLDGEEELAAASAAAAAAAAAAGASSSSPLDGSSSSVGNSSSRRSGRPADPGTGSSGPDFGALFLEGESWAEAQHKAAFLSRVQRRLMDPSFVAGLQLEEDLRRRAEEVAADCRERAQVFEQVLAAGAFGAAAGSGGDLLAALKPRLHEDLQATLQPPAYHATLRKRALLLRHLQPRVAAYRSAARRPLLRAPRAPPPPSAEESSLVRLSCSMNRVCLVALRAIVQFAGTSPTPSSSSTSSSDFVKLPLLELHAMARAFTPQCFFPDVALPLSPPEESVRTDAATATASSVDGARTAEKALDEQSNSYWSSKKRPGTTLWTVQLAQPAHVSAVTLTFQQSFNSVFAPLLVRVQVCYDPDGARFETVGALRLDSLTSSEAAAPLRIPCPGSSNGLGAAGQGKRPQQLQTAHSVRLQLIGHARFNEQGYYGLKAVTIHQPRADPSYIDVRDVLSSLQTWLGTVSRMPPSPSPQALPPSSSTSSPHPHHHRNDLHTLALSAMERVACASGLLSAVLRFAFALLEEEEEPSSSSLGTGGESAASSPSLSSSRAGQFLSRGAPPPTLPPSSLSSSQGGGEGGAEVDPALVAATEHLLECVEEEARTAKGKLAQAIAAHPLAPVLAAAFDPYEMSASGLTISEDGAHVRCQTASHSHAYLNVGFKEGRWAWEFLLAEDITNDESICLGAGTKPVSSSSYNSSPNLWMYRCYNGNLYRKGGQLSGVSKERVHPGDTVRVELDHEQHTLRYILNGERDQGVCFTDVSGEVFPAVAFYGANRAVRLMAVESIGPSPGPGMRVYPPTDPFKRRKWAGEMAAGLRHGFGRLAYAHGKGEWVGTWKQDRQHGLHAWVPAQGGAEAVAIHVFEADSRKRLATESDLAAAVREWDGWRCRACGFVSRRRHEACFCCGGAKAAVAVTEEPTAAADGGAGGVDPAAADAAALQALLATREGCCAAVMSRLASLGALYDRPVGEGDGDVSAAAGAATAAGGVVMAAGAGAAAAATGGGAGGEGSNGGGSLVIPPPPPTAGSSSPSPSSPSVAAAPSPDSGDGSGGGGGGTATATEPLTLPFCAEPNAEVFALLHALVTLPHKRTRRREQEQELEVQHRIVLAALRLLRTNFDRLALAHVDPADVGIDVHADDGEAAEPSVPSTEEEEESCGGGLASLYPLRRTLEALMSGEGGQKEEGDNGLGQAAAEALAAGMEILYPDTRVRCALLGQLLRAHIEGEGSGSRAKERLRPLSGRATLLDRVLRRFGTNEGVVALLPTEEEEAGGSSHSAASVEEATALLARLFDALALEKRRELAALVEEGPAAAAAAASGFAETMAALLSAYLRQLLSTSTNGGAATRRMLVRFARMTLAHCHALVDSALDAAIRGSLGSPAIEVFLHTTLVGQLLPLLGTAAPLLGHELWFAAPLAPLVAGVIQRLGALNARMPGARAADAALRQLERGAAKGRWVSLGQRSEVLSAAFDPREHSEDVSIEDGGRLFRSAASSNQHALANVGFKSGRAAWEFRLESDSANDECSALGAAVKPVASSSYESCPNMWMRRSYNGQLYHGTSAGYGALSKVHPGDVVRVEVDLDAHTLSFKRNGEEEGVAFTDLEGEVFPAVCTYRAGIEVRLLKVEAWSGEAEGLEAQDPLTLRFDGRRGRAPPVGLAKVDECDNAFAHVDRERDEQWATAVTTRALLATSGARHVWELCVRRCGKAMLAVGVCAAKAWGSQAAEAQVGMLTGSWAWRTDGTLWAHGEQVAAGYGSGGQVVETEVEAATAAAGPGHLLTDGDVVTVTLDTAAGTLAFAVNGRDSGLAFGPLGSGAAAEGPVAAVLLDEEADAAEGELYPAVSLKHAGDCVIIRPAGTVGTVALPWLLDLEHTLAAAGALLAGTATAGPCFSSSEMRLSKWAASPLLVSPPLAVVTAPPAAAVAEEKEDGSDGDGDVEEEAAGLEVDGLPLQELLGEMPTASQEADAIRPFSSRRTGRKRPLPTTAAALEADGTMQRFLSLLGHSPPGQPQQQSPPPSSSAARLAKWLDPHGGGRITKRLCEAYPELAAAETACLAALCCAAGVAGEALVGVLEREEGAPLPPPSERARRCGKRMQELRMALIRKHQALKEEQARREAAAEEAAMAMAAAAAAVVGAAGKGEGDDDEEKEEKVEDEGADETLTVVPAHHRGGQPSGDGSLLSSSIGSSSSSSIAAATADAPPLLLPSSSSSASLDDSGASNRSGRTAVLRFAPSARVDLLRTDSMDSAVSPGTPLAMMEEELRMARETAEADADDMAARARVGRPGLPLPPTAAAVGGGGGGGLPQRHRASSSASSYLSLSGSEATTVPPQHQPPQPHTAQAFAATANALLAKATFALTVLAEHPPSTGKGDDARLQACAELLLAQDLQDVGQLQQLLVRRRARAACRRHGLRCYRALIHATSELPSVQAHAIAHLRAAISVRALLPAAAAAAAEEGQQQREQEGERPPPAAGGAMVSPPAAAAPPVVGSGHHYLAGLEGIPPQLAQAVRRDFMALYSSLLALATRALQRQHVPLACHALAAWALDFRPAGGQDAGFLLRAGLPSHLGRLLSLPRLARCLAADEEKAPQQPQQQWVAWPLRDVRAGLSEGRLTKRAVLAHMLAHSSMEEEEKEEGIDALVSRLSVGEVVRRYERLLRQVAADRQSEAAALLRQEAEAKAMARRARGVRYTYVVTATNGVGVRRLPDTAAERTGHSYKQHEVVEVSYRLRLSSGQTYLKLAHPQTQHGHGRGRGGGGGWVFDVGVRGSYKDRSIMRCIAAEPYAEAEEAAAVAAATARRLRAGVGKAAPLVEVAPPALHGGGRSSGAGRLVDIPASAPHTAYYLELAGRQLALVCGLSVLFPLLPSSTSEEDDPSYYEVTVRCTGAEGDVCVGLLAVKLTEGEENGERGVELLALEEAPPGYTRRSCGLHAREWGVWADGAHVRSYPLAVPPPSSSPPPSTVAMDPTAAAAAQPRRLASAAEAWGANADPLAPRLDWSMPPHEGGTSLPSALTTLRRRLALSALRGGDALDAARAAPAGASRSGNGNGNAQENGGVGGSGGGGGFPGRLAETILGLRALVPGILPPNAPLPSFLRAASGAGNAIAPAPATASTEPLLPAELTAYLEEEARRSSQQQQQQQQHPWRLPPSTLTRPGALRRQLTIPTPARRRRVSFKESAPPPPPSSMAVVEGEVAEAKGVGEGLGVMDAKADVRTRAAQQPGGGATEPAVAEAKEGPSPFPADDEDEDNDDEMVIGEAEEEETSTCRLPPLAEGDVLGCGVDRPKALVFFTHNGRRLPGGVPLSRVAPEAFQEQENSSSSWSLVPLMSLHSHCETIEANFGPEFVYRPDAVVEAPTVVAAVEEEEMEEEKKEAEAAMVDAKAAMTLPTLLLSASPSPGLTSFPTPRGADEGGEGELMMGVGLSVPEVDALHATAWPLLQLLAVQGVELVASAAAISSPPLEEADTHRTAARPSSNGLAHACLGLLGEQLRLCAGAIAGTRGAIEAGGGAAALAAAQQLQRAEPAKVESLSFRYLLQLLPFVEAGAATAATSDPKDGGSSPVLRLLLGSPSGSENGLLPALFPLLRKGSPRVQRLSLRVLRRALVASTPQTADAAAARYRDGMGTPPEESKSSLANKDASPSVSSVGLLLARISRTLGGAAGLQIPLAQANEEEEDGEMGAGVGHARMALACEEACLLRSLLAQPQWRPTVWAALRDALAAGAPTVVAAVAAGRPVAVEEQLASLGLEESKRSEKRRTPAPFFSSRLKQQPPQSPQEQKHEVVQPLLGTLAAVFVLADQDMLRVGGAVERAVPGGGGGSGSGSQQLGGVERFTVVRYRRGDAEVVVTDDGSSNGTNSGGSSAKPTANANAASGSSGPPPLLSLPIGLFASGAAVPVPEVATPRLTEELTRPLLAALHALLTALPPPPSDPEDDEGSPLAGLLERLRTLALCALRTLLAHFRQAWSEPLIPRLASQLFRLALSPVNLPFCPPTARLEARLQLLQERTYESVALGPAYLSSIPSRERASAPAAVAVLEDDYDEQGRKPLYRVVLKEGAVVRAGVSIDASERVRVLKAGAVVEVLEACTATGVRRLRIEDGWISERCHGGAEDVIVERVTRAMADGVRLLPPSCAVGMGEGMVDPATVPKEGVKHRLHEAPLRLVTPASLFPDAPCWDCDHCNATFAGDEARTAFASVGPGNTFILCLNCFASDPRAFALARGLPAPPPRPPPGWAAAGAQAASNGSGSASSSRRASPEALDGPWGRLGAASATGAVIRAASRRRGATTSAAAAAAGGGGASTTHRGMLESAAALLMDDLLPNHRALMAAEHERSAAGTGAGATFIPYGAGPTDMSFTLPRRGNGSGGSGGSGGPLPLPPITMVGASAGGRLDVRTPSPAGASAATTGTGTEAAAQARLVMQEHASVDGGSSAPTASLGLARGLTGAATGGRASASSASSAASIPSSASSSSATVTRAAMTRLTEMGFDEAAVRAAVAAAFPATAAGLAPGMEGLEHVVEQAIEILTAGAMPASRRRSGGSGGGGLLVQDEDEDDEEEESSDGSDEGSSESEGEEEEEEEEEEDSESDTEDEDAGGRGGVLRGSSARSGLFRRRYEGELDDEEEEEEEEDDDKYAGLPFLDGYHPSRPAYTPTAPAPARIRHNPGEYHPSVPAYIPEWGAAAAASPLVAEAKEAGQSAAQRRGRTPFSPPPPPTADAKPSSSDEEDGDMEEEEEDEIACIGTPGPRPSTGRFALLGRGGATPAAIATGRPPWRAEAKSSNGGASGNDSEEGRLLGLLARHAPPVSSSSSSSTQSPAQQQPNAEPLPNLPRDRRPLHTWRGLVAEKLGGIRALCRATGCPPSLCRAALELAAGDEAVARRWLGVHGHRYLPRAGRLSTMYPSVFMALGLVAAGPAEADDRRLAEMAALSPPPGSPTATGGLASPRGSLLLAGEEEEGEVQAEAFSAAEQGASGAAVLQRLGARLGQGEMEEVLLYDSARPGAGGRRASPSSASAADAAVGGNVPAAAGGGAAGVGVGAAVAASEAGAGAASRHELVFEEAVLEPLEVERRSARHKVVVGLVCTRCRYLEFPGCSQHAQLLSVRKPNGHGKCARCSCATDLHSPWDKGCRVCRAPTEKCFWAMTVRETQFLLRAFPPACRTSGEDSCEVHVLRCPDCSAVGFPGVCGSSESEDEKQQHQQAPALCVRTAAGAFTVASPEQGEGAEAVVLPPETWYARLPHVGGCSRRGGPLEEVRVVVSFSEAKYLCKTAANVETFAAYATRARRLPKGSLVALTEATGPVDALLGRVGVVAQRQEEEDGGVGDGLVGERVTVELYDEERGRLVPVTVPATEARVLTHMFGEGLPSCCESEENDSSSSSSSSSSRSLATLRRLSGATAGMLAARYAREALVWMLSHWSPHHPPTPAALGITSWRPFIQLFKYVGLAERAFASGPAPAGGRAFDAVLAPVSPASALAEAASAELSSALIEDDKGGQGQVPMQVLQHHHHTQGLRLASLSAVLKRQVALWLQAGAESHPYFYADGVRGGGAGAASGRSTPTFASHGPDSLFQALLTDSLENLYSIALGQTLTAAETSEAPPSSLVGGGDRPPFPPKPALPLPLLPPPPPPTLRRASSSTSYATYHIPAPPSPPSATAAAATMETEEAAAAVAAAGPILVRQSLHPFFGPCSYGEEVRLPGAGSLRVTLDARTALGPLGSGEATLSFWRSEDEPSRGVRPYKRFPGKHWRGLLQQQQQAQQNGGGTGAVGPLISFVVPHSDRLYYAFEARHGPPTRPSSSSSPTAIATTGSRGSRPPALPPTRLELEPTNPCRDDYALDKEGTLVRCLGGFPSLAPKDVLLTSGKWYYEVTMVKAGLAQLGWADARFTGHSARGEGVGDDTHSWGLDGHRVYKWHGGGVRWGSKWSDGDVLGFAADVDRRTLSFSLNGEWGAPMGLAFEDVSFSEGLRPCLTLNKSCAFVVNFGADCGKHPLRYPPPLGHRPVAEAPRDLALRRTYWGYRFEVAAAVGLQTKPAAEFKLLWHSSSSSGSTPEEAGGDGGGCAIWRPKAGSGHALFGDVVTSGGGAKPGATLVVADDDSPYLAPPRGYKRVLTLEAAATGGGNGTLQGCLWRPLPPDGYVALGDVFAPGYTEPELGLVRCLRRDAVEPAPLYRRAHVWRGATDDEEDDSGGVSSSSATAIASSSPRATLWGVGNGCGTFVVTRGFGAPGSEGFTARGWRLRPSLPGAALHQDWASEPEAAGAPSMEWALWVLDCFLEACAPWELTAGGILAGRTYEALVRCIVDAPACTDRTRAPAASLLTRLLRTRRSLLLGGMPLDDNMGSGGLPLLSRRALAELPASVKALGRVSPDLLRLCRARVQAQGRLFLPRDLQQVVELVTTINWGLPNAMALLHPLTTAPAAAAPASNTRALLAGSLLRRVARGDRPNDEEALVDLIALVEFFSSSCGSEEGMAESLQAPPFCATTLRAWLEACGAARVVETAHPLPSPQPTDSAPAAMMEVDGGEVSLEGAEFVEVVFDGRNSLPPGVTLALTGGNSNAGAAPLDWDAGTGLITWRSGNFATRLLFRGPRLRWSLTAGGDAAVVTAGGSSSGAGKRKRGGARGRNGGEDGEGEEEKEEQDLLASLSQRIDRLALQFEGTGTAPAPPRRLLPTAAVSVDDHLPTSSSGSAGGDAYASAWGVGFTVLTKRLSPATRLRQLQEADSSREGGLLAAFPRFGDAAEGGGGGEGEWSVEHDAAIVEWLNAAAEALGCEGVEVSPFDFRHGGGDTTVGLQLRDAPVPLIYLRIALIQGFNRLVRQLLPLLDLGNACRHSLGHRLRGLSHLVLKDVKMAVVEAGKERTQGTGGNALTITLDNFAASRSMEAGETSIRTSRCIFVQAFRALHHKDPKLLRSCWDGDRVFQVTFRGENGSDAGGVFREGMSRVVEDLHNPAALSLLTPCPNARHGLPTNVDKSLPNPRLSGCPLAGAMLEFVGKLMGMSLRAHLCLPFQFPSLVWKRLLGQELTFRGDMQAVDTLTCRLLDSVRACTTPEDFEAKFGGSLTFVVTGHDGAEMELFPGGGAECVVFETRERYCDLLADYHLHEYDGQIQAIARGLYALVPRDTLLLLTWRELETLVCGSPSFDLAFWRRHTTYSGYTEGDITVQLFWKVLASLTEEEQSGFVRFAWGRSRLPPKHAWFKDMQISRRDTGEDSLPASHTCFFSIELPPYKTEAAMRKGLLTAIHYGMVGILNT